MTKPRVLVVDDSAFARTVLSRVLRVSDKLDVIGTARDGEDALAKIKSLDPDVVTLDLTMPNLDGIGVLRALAGRARPRVIVVSISSVDTELGAEALTLGAVDLVAKPTALANERLAGLGGELIAKILAVAVAAPGTSVWPATVALPSTAVELVMIGTSTGGPQALTRLIAALPGGLGAPVCIALHIPEGYTQSLAARLDRSTELRVMEASPGIVLEPGMVVLARGGSQLGVLRVGPHLVADVTHDASRPFAPSVDHLFETGARAVGAAALGVVMTGMGDDGLTGARAIKAAGGSLITESSSTCIVYGMPRCVDEARLGALSLPLDAIGAAIVRAVNRR